jgi:hypothetical protein
MRCDGMRYQRVTAPSSRISHAARVSDTNTTAADLTDTSHHSLSAAPTQDFAYSNNNQ